MPIIQAIINCGAISQAKVSHWISLRPMRVCMPITMTSISTATSTRAVANGHCHSGYKAQSRPTPSSTSAMPVQPPARLNSRLKSRSEVA